MSILNTDCDVADITYTILDEGRHAGRPIVTIAFGDAKQELSTVQSIKALMDRYGWTDHIRARRTPLVFTGADRAHGSLPYDPAYERHAEALTTLVDVLRPSTVWLHNRGVAEPTDDVAALADYHLVHLTQNQARNYRDGDREVWQWYAQEARDRNGATVDFVIEGHTMTVEEIIQDVSRNYTIPDDRIILYPKGETIEEVNDCFYKLVAIAKRNEWRISPRMSFLDDVTAGHDTADGEEEGSEDE